MPFEKGQSGNPAGRPQGALGKVTKYRQQLEDAAPQILNKLIELAKDGDIQALRICVERLIPKTNMMPVNLVIENEPDLVGSSTYPVLVGKELIKQTAAGEVSPDIAKVFISVLESHRRIIEMNEIEPLVIQLKAVLEKQKNEMR